jgi:hypothetical protein
LQWNAISLHDDRPYHVGNERAPEDGWCYVEKVKVVSVDAASEVAR